MDTQRKVALLGSLYLAQGLPFGFFTQSLPALLRQLDVSLPWIGAASFLALPWSLKFLWAPYVDRTGWARLGRRRSWILPLQLVAAANLVVVAGLDPREQLPLVLAAVLVTNLLAATQDIATDGLAVELLEPAERGLGNGVQVAGYRVGMILGGGALLVTYDALGWAGTFLIMATILLASTLPVALHAERPPAHPAPSGTFEAIWGYVSRPGAPEWLAFLLTFKLGEALAGGMLKPMLIDLGLELADIGWVLGTAGFTAGLLGALAGGWGAGAIGRYPALLLFGALQAMTCGIYVLVPTFGAALGPLTALALIEHFVGGMATAALFTLMMDACRPGSAGSDYTVQASVVVLSTGLGAGGSGVIAEATSYEATFVLGAILSALALAPAALVARRGGFRAAPAPAVG